MPPLSRESWRRLVVPVSQALALIRPGMSIFLGTGAAEPRTLVRHLMDSDAPNLADLELIQLVSFGEAISIEALKSQRFRLKTFFSGWVSEDAITEGQVDLIPSRFSWLPDLIESDRVHVDTAFVQVTPPNDAGYCSLGIAVDIAALAMDKASMVVGEINPWIPQTFGDTFVPVSSFDHLVESSDPPHYLTRWPRSPVFDRVAANVAELIPDGACIAFSIGPLYEALSRHLDQRNDLGVHSPLFTDALMDLVRSGAVTNRLKAVHPGKSLASYALGTPLLMEWLNRNPLVEFQRVDRVFDPVQIGRNPRFVAVLPARRVDLAGRIALQVGKGNIATGPAEVVDIFRGAELSRGGKTLFALPSRGLDGRANIVISTADTPNRLGLHESVDRVVTEYGSVSLRGLTLRERAQAIIEIAHPDDRQRLVDQAKEKKILYADQIFLAESGLYYPGDIALTHRFKNGQEVRFRGIRPSDEREMRRLFYRFSDESVYYRYFSTVRTMPHARMQAYVNVDWRNTLSVVGLVGEPGRGHIIAETRYIIEPDRPWAEIVFVVDEAYQGIGIGTFLYGMLTRLAKERGLKGFTAQVLFSNIGMMKVFKRGDLLVKVRLEGGEYELTIPFDEPPSPSVGNVVRVDG